MTTSLTFGAPEPEPSLPVSLTFGETDAPTPTVTTLSVQTVGGWVPGIIKGWDGSAWVPGILRRWDGSAWG